MPELAPKPMPMPLKRLYKRILTIPILFLLGAFLAYSIYENYTYKSEWLTAEAFLPIEFALVIAHCAIVCCLCLPIFANKRSGVKGNRLWSFLSWFLCPMLYLGWLLYRCVPQEGELADVLLLLSATLPFMVSLVVTFIQFQRSLRYPHTLEAFSLL